MTELNTNVMLLKTQSDLIKLKQRRSLEKEDEILTTQKTILAKLNSIKDIKDIN